MVEGNKDKISASTFTGDQVENLESRIRAWSAWPNIDDQIVQEYLDYITEHSSLGEYLYQAMFSDPEDYMALYHDFISYLIAYHGYVMDPDYLSREGFQIVVGIQQVNLSQKGEHLTYSRIKPVGISPTYLSYHQVHELAIDLVKEMIEIQKKYPSLTEILRPTKKKEKAPNDRSNKHGT